MIIDILPSGETGITLLEALISGVGLLLATLLAIIGWFLKGFSQSVKELKTTVEKLMTTVAVEQERISNVKDNVGEFSIQLNNKITSIAVQVDKHEKDIAILKTLENEYHNIIL